MARAGSVEAWVRHYYQQQQQRRRQQHQRWDGDDAFDVEAAARFAARQQQQHQRPRSGPSLWALALTALLASVLVKAWQNGALRLSV